MAEAANIERKLAAMANWRTGLEPGYLLRLFFRFPPQGFMAWPQQIILAPPADSVAGKTIAAAAPAAMPLFACRFNLLTVLEPAWLKKLKKLPFYRGFGRMLSFKTLFAGATVSEFLPLPLPLPAAGAAAAAAALRAAGDDWPFVIAKDLPQGENALVGADIAAAAAAFDAALAARGFISVEGQALAYVPVDFADINAYLARFSKARRKNFRRKLRARGELAIDILTKGAAEFYDEAALALYYRLYEQVYAQSETHFDYLSRDFFRALLQEADESLRFIRYHDKAGRLIGYNICFIVGDRLVDKYIGLDYPAATDYSLYFVSWFYNLEYACAQGLRYYVAGWTDPQVKACLGAKFVMTRHRVFIRNPLLRAALRRLQFLFEGDAAAAAGRAPKAIMKAGQDAR